MRWFCFCRSLFIVASVVVVVVVCVWGGYGWSLLIVHYLVSSFAIICLEEKESWMLYFNCLLMSFENKCPVSLPRGGALGLSTVCNCGVS